MTTTHDAKDGAVHIERQPDHIQSDMYEKPEVEAPVAEYVEGSIEEKRLVRKIDIHLLPMLWIMYVLNYLDRTNIGNAKVGADHGGFEGDWNLSSADYSLILSIFFVGYLLWEVPSNMMLARSKPSIFLPTIMFIWGAMSIGAKGMHSLGGMVAFRFVLGLVEAGFFPGVMLLMSCWYKPHELSKRIALFYTASLVAGAFGGLLSFGIMDGLEGKGNTRGWQWLFIIEGLITVVVACAAFFVLPNYPTTTKWLSEDEKRLATARLLAVQREGAEEEPHMGHWMAFKLACKDPKTWVFVLIYNLFNMVGTISYFFPTLLGSMGYKGNMRQLMTVPIYVVALIISVTLGFVADKTRQKAYVVAGGATLATISFIIVAAVPNNQVKYAFLCFGGGGVWTCVPVFLSWMVTMFDGREKRAVCIALINGFGNTASIYGSFFWPKHTAPKYIMGFSLTTAFSGVALITVLAAKYFFGDKGVARTS
ncbi:hypothetical protein CcaverHIS002_0308860 [Cutaneotrichosporon cavernicola]|uniref:Major facilitator superfamily (MFS) profile domain-containing protein n=1 Tax=Cutaneotrichosporon cavernicola TaxID=279322 RepID=A0AA48L159_9TREE|nr:uncharacterized protein CcaverHIS019_0308710 [Cutaneotrichosporon cavernicola]BEI83018.1 hypothetical protein CcaverHIS002_0308860 [Cutaneotrichosporon cavernicola]BEI90801.1 hypothetical protein CcaverHIS019_0308710 [Cutaneotrichosporon cavernicola]BEI98580.1 hypothetical protein CcaverHIS631_0308790 [Cutaneotrichosporon cavernicola]BEJ06350.1 hypothetical protein CcaverHIS641_0308720 [Cutaneotrichosporon cavernicola]